MECKQSYLNSLFSCGLLMLFLVGLSITVYAQPSHTLYVSSIFTPKNSFTSDVEGPAVDGSGTVYACNFAREGTIGQVTPSGEASLFIELPKGSIGNGVRFDSYGNMLISDYARHNVFKVDMSTRKLSVLAHEPRMYEPNDLAIDSKDRVYASDPNFKTHKGFIWRIDPDGEVVLLDRIEGAANGIEVSPDEKKLYVNAHRKVWVYDLSVKGKVSHKRLLIEFNDFGTDGMRTDIKGNLYIARIGKGAVAKISPKGKIIRDIELIGKKPTNIAFGGENGCTIYVTMMDQGNLESFRVDTPGRGWEKQRGKN